VSDIHPTMSDKPRRRKAAPAPVTPAGADPSLAMLFGTDPNGDPSLNIPGVMQYLQGTYQQARAANEGRYAEQRKVLDQGYDAAEQFLSGAGTTQKQDNQVMFDQQLGGQQQSLTDRGLYNSTLLDVLTTRNREALARANNAVDQNVAQARAGLAERRAGAVSGAISDRMDEYPQVDQYLGLVQQASAEKAAERARQQDRADRQQEYQQYLDEPVAYQDSWNGSMVRTRRGAWKPAPSA